jgi:uncharacterized protein
VLGHGVTGNKDRPLLVALAEGLAARGWPCLRLSFAGNGGSQGDFAACTIAKEAADLHAVFAALPAGIEVAYLGHSMGAAAGLVAAVADPRPRALVSVAGMFDPAAFYAREFAALAPGAGCMWDEPACPLSQAFADDMRGRGPLAGAAAALAIPWLLVHGDADDLVPPGDSRAAADAAGGQAELVIVPGAGHSFDDSTYPVLIETIARWLDRQVPV